MIAGVIAAAARVLLTVYIAREFGLAVLGEYAVIASVAAVLGVLDIARVQDLTTRYASGLGHHHNKAKIALLGVALVAIALGATGYGALSTPRVGEAAAVAWFGAVTQIATSEVTAAAQVCRRFQLIALATTVAALAGTGVSVALASHFDLTGLTVGLVVTGLGHRLILIGCADVRATLREARHEKRGVDRGLFSLVLLGGAAQVVTVTDTLSIRALSSTSQVGVYRAASQVPTQLAGLLYRGFDTLLSRLAGADENSAASLVRRPAVVLACVNGAVLGLLINFREPVMTLMLGESSGQADRVVALFAVVWLLNGAVHPAALLLIARRRQGSLLRLIGAEYAANLVLTIALVPSLGATGSAVATLVTLGASNLVFLPRILRRELPSLPVRRHLLVECLLPAVAVSSLAVGVGWIIQQ